MKRKLPGHSLHQVTHTIVEIFIIAFLIGLLGFIAYVAMS